MNFNQSYSPYFLPRKSSKIRVKTGTIVSTYLSANFAFSTALMHEFTRLETAYFIGVYSGTAFALSLSYFAINELVYGRLKARNIENYFLSYSLTSALIMPFFAYLQVGLRQKSWREARFLAYRYVGTLCCGSLIAELLLCQYKYKKLGLFQDIKLKNLISKNEDTDTN
ncbi:hypothetical protein SteCoe_28631 [Stentor coeruleus]|uniref:Uncharacterized protein n=1 Tax=Stentor coeruleus TaxID=5963 RepID=A0A1R2B8B4_9CILI|nr:hypothetical protein SteCoe_28631 [Stentor coeruleus]